MSRLWFVPPVRFLREFIEYRFLFQDHLRWPQYWACHSVFRWFFQVMWFCLNQVIVFMQQVLQYVDRWIVLLGVGQSAFISYQMSIAGGDVTTTGITDNYSSFCNNEISTPDNSPICKAIVSTVVALCCETMCSTWLMMSWHTASSCTWWFRYWLRTLVLQNLVV